LISQGLKNTRGNAVFPSINIIIMNNIIKIHDCMTEEQDIKECRTGAVGCYRVGRHA